MQFNASPLTLTLENLNLNLYRLYSIMPMASPRLKVIILVGIYVQSEGITALKAH